MSEPIKVTEDAANQIRSLLGETEDAVVLQVIRKDATVQDYVFEPMEYHDPNPIDFKKLRVIPYGYCYIYEGSNYDCYVCCGSAGCSVWACWPKSS